MINTKQKNPLGNRLVVATVKMVVFACYLGMFYATLPIAGAQTVIGGSTPEPSSMLDVQSTSKGVLFPRMTASQRDAIASPATGLLIFNTDISSLEINLGTPASPSWQVIIRGPGTVATLDCNNFRFVGANLRSTVAASGNSVRIPYTGGNGWKYDGQTVASTGVTGLTATLAAGSFATGADSLTYTITGTPNADGLAAFALDIGGQSCTLNIVVGCGAYVAAGQWKVFSCYNLGAANTSADPFTPSWEINGNYYQWGANPTCFELDGTPPTCPSTVYGAAGPFGNSTSDDNDGGFAGWNLTPAADQAWVDAPATKTADDPCPFGFRVPSEADWTGVINTALNPQSDAAGSTWSSSSTNYVTGMNFGAYLMLPAAGQRRSINNGSLFNRGSSGYYWSSSVNGPSAWSLYFIFVGAFESSSTRTNGLSIRCIAE